ncbi:hypothetical protein [Aquisalimonas sp.]|uniref:hypothetical protein n=1 Tax=Aquisalimonas sp. TaxID=1872621 RepID=UPI0025B8469C|nr:hypothetical protein [Aquisalimonas sp.]
MKDYALWFRRMVLLGVAVNLLLAIPGVFVPNTVIALVGGTAVANAVWPAFASLLIILLSLFYVVAAFDPFRYLPVAWLTVAARFAGVCFFLVLHPQYLLFAFIDLFFGLSQGVLLLLALRQPRL